MNGVESASLEVLPQSEKSMDSGDFSILDIESLHISPSNSLSSAEQELVQQRLSELLQDNQSMKEALETNNAMMREQLNTISAWHTQMTSSMSRQQLSLQEAKNQVSRLKEENTLLSMQLESSKRVEMPSLPQASPQDEFEFISRKESEDLISLKKQLSDTQAEFDDKIAEKKLKIEELQVDMLALKGKIREKEEQANFLQQQLDEERNVHSDTLKSLTCVQTNYDRVTRLLEIQSKERDEKANFSANTELLEKRHQEEIDAMTAQLLDLQLKLEERDEENKEYSKAINSLRLEAEQVPLLRAEMEAYKSSRENSDKHQDNVQQEEAVSSNDSRHQRGHKSHRSKKEGGAWKQDKDLIICPICSAGFADLQAAESHVNSCIDGPTI